jgi:hypothetical protein
VWTALVVAALALLAVVAAAAEGYVLWRGAARKAERAPVRDEVPAAPEAAKAEAKVTRARPDAVALAWLDELERQGRGGRGVEVELVGSAPDEDGVHRLRAGQSLRLRVRASEAGYVGVWTIAPDGVITQLFPCAEAREDNHLQAGGTLEFPRDGALVATPDGGRERLLVLRTSQPWDLARGVKEGPYFVFRDLGEARKLRQGLRGLTRVPGFSSKVVPFEVVEREGAFH